MELKSIKSTLKAKTLGLALAAFLIPAGMASAHDAGHPVVVKKTVSGHVDVVHQVPGGTVSVGVDWGKQRPQPPVVVVREPAKVIVVEKEHRHGYRERGRHGDRHVTVIHEEPRRQVTVIRQAPVRREVTIIRRAPVRKEVVVIEKRNGHDRGYEGDREGHERVVYVR